VAEAASGSTDTSYVISARRERAGIIPVAAREGSSRRPEQGSPHAGRLRRPAAVPGGTNLDRLAVAVDCDRQIPQVERDWFRLVWARGFDAE